MKLVFLCFFLFFQTRLSADEIDHNDVGYAEEYYRYTGANREANNDNLPAVGGHNTEIKNNSPCTNNMSLNQAKTTCKDLGFKPKTEKFGNCVLELTK